LIGLFVLLDLNFWPLFILNINPQFNEYLARIFSHSVGCLFCLVIVSFVVQKFLIWCNYTCQFLLLFSDLLSAIQKVTAYACF
jgi:membrane-bound metal-dependent hydrolase YbcI (DUF457 family)